MSLGKGHFGILTTVLHFPKRAVPMQILDYAGDTKGGSITVLLTSYLTGLD